MIVIGVSSPVSQMLAFKLTLRECLWLSRSEKRVWTLYTSVKKNDSYKPKQECRTDSRERRRKKMETLSSSLRAITN